MAKQWSHLLLVNMLPAPLPPVGIDVHQEALRPVGCKVREGYEAVIKKGVCVYLFYKCVTDSSVMKFSLTRDLSQNAQSN